ncbi:MAG: hypothetical protein WD766_05050 [Gemmatimonadota bacterium]
MSTRSLRLLGAPWLLGGLSLLVVGCGGDNLFEDPLSGLAGGDRRNPIVLIQAPDSGQRVAIGDSVLVTVRASDDSGIAEIGLAGFALRGSASLGTLTEVPRFQPKLVELEDVRPIVTDTTISRYLVAVADTETEDSVFIVATASDVGGNESADTLRIAIGGPRVQIVAPLTGQEVRADSDLRVTLSASDPDHRIQSIRLRSSGTFAADTVLTFENLVTAVDTVVVLPVPATAAQGEFELRATAKNAVNDSTISPAVRLELLAPQADTRLPSVRFRMDAPARAERDDSVAVTVVASDETRLDRVGVTILPTHRLNTGTEALTVVTDVEPRDSTTFRFPLSAFDLPVPRDTSTLRLEVTAFAFDEAGNCASATIANGPGGETLFSDACAELDPVFGVRSGARFEILVVRGLTIPVGSPGDRVVDIVADASRLYLSNFSQNRLEVLPLGTMHFSDTYSVGSRPWGLAFNQASDRLYVANSGGTNISVLEPSSGDEVERIQTPNVKLFDVTFQTALVPNEATVEENDSIVSSFPTSVVRHDYSDRPQFIGVTRNDNVIYSTLPTSAASEGTVRILHRNLDRLEIVTDYAERRIGTKVVVANADSVFLVQRVPQNHLRVCPRNRSENPALDRQLPLTCFSGSIEEVQTQIAVAGYDTEFRYNIDITEVGLSDTTFVAVSGDHSVVAFAEGARENGRVMAFEDRAGLSDGPLIKFGEIRDLVGNAAERVFALALNTDGSLGLARGSEAFVFSDTLRLQGVIQTEQGTGGVDMHPDHPTRQLAFVSGAESTGLAFVDVMDTFSFRRVSRIFLRDPVTGPLTVVRLPDGELKIYAITASGLVTLDVNTSDL